MIKDIAILISGNPVSWSGARSIGGIGAGLMVIDPVWPSMAQGNLALIITDKGQSSNYCLMFPSRLISSANHVGGLNIQLQLPHGKVLADAEGNKVSPFTLLEVVFNHYKQHHLTQYPGVEGWNFAKDWEMTQAEFDSLFASYTLIDRVLPNRHLSGTGEAFIAMSPDKMSLFTLDYAYPELVDYGKVILSTSGNTNPPELARLEIPRRPKFEIYVNGKKQDGLMREGDEAFSMTIEPPYTYQKPANITVDFEKAVAEGKVDRVNERINYTVKFEDKEETKTVRIKLTGCEDNRELYDSLIEKLLDVVYLISRSSDKPIYPIDRNASTRTLTFKVKGIYMQKWWEPKLSVLPANVKFTGKGAQGGGNFVMGFHYEKPAPKSVNKPVHPSVTVEQKSGVESKTLMWTERRILGFLVKTLLVLLVFCIGMFVGISLNILPKSGTEAPVVNHEPVVAVGENGRVYIDDIIEVTIGENGHWFINGNDMGRTPNNGIPDEKTPTSNAGRDVDDPAPTGSDNVNYAALNAKSARYMELIGKAEMSFPQVDEIKKWIGDNRQHRRKIDNYGKIAAAMIDYGKCRDVLLKINAGADIEALCPQIKNVVSSLSKDSLSRELRIKMQRFIYEDGKLLRNDMQIMEKIYYFSRMHPDGIRSFKELEDLKEIRVLK